MKPVDAERIHEAALALLWDPGVRLEHDGVRRLLLDAGAKAGAATCVIRFPRELVAECMARAPARVLLADRRGGVVELEAGSTGAVWSVPGLNILRQGVHRPFTRNDMADVTRLLDRLPNVSGVFGLAMADVAAGGSDVVGLRIMAENTRKHIRVLCFTPEGAEALCRMREAVSDAPWFSVGFTAHGPLRWTNLALEIFARTAGHGIPVTVNGEPMAGASGPVTLAGTAAVGNAEILAGLVVNQLLEPGRPCIYNLGLAHVFDMRTAVAVTGGPENHLLAGISAEMGRFYNVPSCSWVSTEAMCADEQAAIEKSMGFLSHMQRGVSLIWGVGQLESEMTFSPAQAVIDDEMVGYARRYVRGAEVTEATLALDVVRSVGIAGEFLSHEHTLEHFRQEFFEPRLLWRRRRADWVEDGSRRLGERAEAMAEDLIREPGPCCLDEAQREALCEIERGHPVSRDFRRD